MSLRERLKDRSVMLRIGMAFLLLGNLVHYFLHPATRLGQDLADGAFGLLFGLSIGCLLLSLRLRHRHCSSD